MFPYKKLEKKPKKKENNYFDTSQFSLYYFHNHKCFVFLIFIKKEKNTNYIHFKFNYVIRVNYFQK